MYFVTVKKVRSQREYLLKLTPAAFVEASFDKRCWRKLCDLV